MAIWTAEVKEIERLYESLRHQFPELGRELGNLIKTDDENVALLYSRRCLEVIVTYLCEAELKRSRGTEPLKGIIDKLQKEEKVPSHITASMHGLNTLSTFGTHPKDFDPEQVKPVLNNLLIIIKWYLRYKDPLTFGELMKEEQKHEAEPEDVREKVKGRSIKRVLFAVTVFLMVAITAIVILSIFNVISLGKLTKDTNFIAVLPFTSLNNDPDQEYFSYGLVEEILDRLCRIGKLKVISHTSSSRFKNTNLSLKEIARQLNASAILEGSVQKQGDNVRITVQLIDAKTDTHLWSKKFENNLTDIFSIYSEVAQAVAGELHAGITQEEKHLLGKVPTTDMAAYDAYLLGRFYWSKLTAKDLETAMQHFELAKERDPEFTLAYAGIASVWVARRQLGMTKPAEATPKIDLAIKRALENDTTQADVYYMLAVNMTWGKFDWIGGESAFKKAIEINPNHAEAHAYYSHLLNILGRREEAMNYIETALKLDPLSSLIQSLYGIDLMFVRRYDDAVKAFRESLDLYPAQPLAGNIVNALYFAGREDEAIEMLRTHQKYNPEYLKALNDGYFEAGFQGAMKKVADLNAERSKTVFIGSRSIGQFYALAGDIDNALLWLEKAYEEHDPNLPYILKPEYDKLRDDPRFQDLCRRLNLPYK
jgi:TolB-like protein